MINTGLQAGPGRGLRSSSYRQPHENEREADVSKWSNGTSGGTQTGYMYHSVIYNGVRPRWRDIDENGSPERRA